MSHFKNMLRTGGLLVAFAIVTAGAAQAQEPQKPQQEPAPAPECQAKVEPAALKQQTEPVSLRAAYSGSIGKVIAALIEEESGAKVLEVQEVAESAPAEPAVQVRLDVSKAVAGEWKLSFQGENGKCAAKVTVQSAETENGTR